MSERVVLTTNYDFQQRLQLKLNDAVFDMSAASLVSAALIDPSDNEIIQAAVSQTDTGNANWSISIVEVVLSEAETLAIQVALLAKYNYVSIDLLLEIRVEQTTGNSAWRYVPIAIEQGFIT